MFGASPNADARLMPSAGQNLIFAFGTIDGKKLGWQVMRVGVAHRHHIVTKANVDGVAKRLLNPELFQSHLAAALNLFFPFAKLFVLHLYGRFRSAMFELYFAAKRPAATEVVAQHQHHMRQIDLTIAHGIFVLRGFAVAIDVVTVEIACKHRLAVAANGESASLARQMFALFLRFFGRCGIGLLWRCACGSVNFFGCLQTLDAAQKIFVLCLRQGNFVLCKNARSDCQ